MASTDPLRLGLALNYSVFYYEIVKSGEEACKIAKYAFDSAIVDMDVLDEENYQDTAVVLQLLKDNLVLWTTDQKIMSEYRMQEEEDKR